jgi:5'-nucleotidase (lipoprotein e(P4) family)
MKYSLFLILLEFCLYCPAPCQHINSNSCNESVHKILPVLWHQQAAEYRALCYQAYAVATKNLNSLLAKNYQNKPRVIITDCDETLLDNSPLYARLIKENKEYSDSAWKKWTDLSIAKAVPGALEFFQWAHEKGFGIYYVSNRDTSEVESTLLNLKKLGFPDAMKSHLLFMSSTSSKEERRQTIMKDNEVVMLLGDNLHDFSDVFRKKTSTERNEQVEILKNEWGNKFIVLPNDIYGGWEDALYNYNFNLTESQKDSLCIQLLNSY